MKYITNYWLLIILLAICKYTGAQDLNVLRNFGFSRTLSAGMVTDNDSIIISGMAVYDTSWYNSFYMIKMDTLGNLTHKYERTKPMGGHYFFHQYSSIITTTDGGYVAVGTASGDTAVFVKLNQNLELDFIKEFRLPDNPRYTQYRNVIEIDEGGYIISGKFQKQNYDVGGFAQRLDSLGNEVWFKKYDQSDYYDLFYSTCQLSNQEILVTGDYGGRGMIALDPADGEIIWETELADQRAYYSYPLENEEFLIGGFKHYGTTVDDFYGQFRVIKFDANHEIVWDVIYDDIDWKFELDFAGMTQTPDGNFVAAGFGINSDLGGHVSIIWKFDANTGEKIWEYLVPENIHGEGGVYISSYLRGVSILSSGSIICAGELERGFPDPLLAAWIIKLSPDGCYTQDSCATMIVGLDDIISQNLLQPKVISYPDPTTDFIQFKIDKGLTHPHEKYATHIYDVSGKTIYTTTISDYISDIHITVSPFESGVYFYTLVGDKGGVFTGKFVKN